jgi:hypothetical protein
MTNHVHWAVIPERGDSLAVLFRRAHGSYAQAMNMSLGWAFVAEPLFFLSVIGAPGECGHAVSDGGPFWVRRGW